MLGGDIFDQALHVAEPVLAHFKAGSIRTSGKSNECTLLISGGLIESKYSQPGSVWERC